MQALEDFEASKNQLDTTGTLDDEADLRKKLDHLISYELMNFIIADDRTEQHLNTLIGSTFGLLCSEKVCSSLNQLDTTKF